jgi:hypothetical protein
MDQPRQFRVDERDGITTIEWRWVGARHLLALVFLAIVCGMYWHWYTDMARDGLSTSEVWFLAVTALLPVLTVYLMLAKILNRSRLVVDANSLALWQGPFPWPGNGSWPRSGLAGFMYKTGRMRGNTWYTVYAVWGDGRFRRIAGDLRDENEARWLATTLDRRFAQGRFDGVAAAIASARR